MRTRMKMLTGMRTKMLEGMKTTLRLPSFLPRIARLRGDDRGAQLVEFAVALPLLVLFVVGIFDFSNAFTFKQKLTNVTRDTARLAAADPANDLQFPSTAAPASVIDAFEDVDKYLVANNINDCGLSTAAASNTPGSLIWTYTVSTNCPGTLTVIINRGYYFSPNLANAAGQRELSATGLERRTNANRADRHLRQHSVSVSVALRRYCEHSGTQPELAARDHCRGSIVERKLRNRL